MAQIVESLATDRRLRLYTEDFARKMGIGTAWTKIRIGLRLSLQATSTANSSLFAFGVCQGDTNTFKSGTTTDFIGAILGTTASQNYAYTAGPPAFITGTSLAAINRIGNTNTIVNTSSSNVVISTAPATIRSILITDIEKNFTNNKVSSWGSTSTTVALDATLATLMTFMESDTLTGLAALTTNNIPYSGSGLWDTVNVSWNNSIQPVEISDVIVTRIY
jgi:hypothetical protein